MGKKVTETRKIVLDMLESIHAGKDKSHILIKNVLDKYDYMDSRDKAFIKKLFTGCLQYEMQLDYIIGMYAKTKNGKMKPVIRDILRMGIYQILYMDQVPDSAACNEAVALAEVRGLSGLSGFVNGVLRSISREKDNIQWPGDLTVVYSMPQWIVSYLFKHFSREEAEAILKDSLNVKDTVFRMDERLSDEETKALIGKIEDSGATIVQHPYLDYAYIISNYNKTEMIPGFMEGKLTVQDISSQLAVHIAGIKKGDKVLDVCAAPGGKTVHSAVKCSDDGHVLSRDLTDYKVSMIEENVQRLGLNNVDVEVYDATVYDDRLLEQFDVIICDLPCSGLGVMGRKVDIKYNASMDGIKELQKLQREILANSVKYLKPGGTLIYSTCTITTEEDEDNRQWILDNLPLKAVSLDEYLPDEIKSSSTSEGYLKLLQGVHKSDGFFISKYVK